jgi:hypothetical protein
VSYFCFAFLVLSACKLFAPCVRLRFAGDAQARCAIARCVAVLAFRCLPLAQTILLTCALVIVVQVQSVGGGEQHRRSLPAGAQIINLLIALLPGQVLLTCFCVLHSVNWAFVRSTLLLAIHVLVVLLIPCSDRRRL